MSKYENAISAAEAFHGFLRTKSHLDTFHELTYIKTTVFTEFKEMRALGSVSTPKFSSLLYFLKLNRIVRHRVQSGTICFRSKGSVFATRAVVDCSAAERNRRKRERRKQQNSGSSDASNSGVEVTPISPAAVSQSERNKHFFLTVDQGDSQTPLDMLIKVKNTSTSTVSITSCQLMSSRGFKLIRSQGSPNLKEGEECQYKITCKHHPDNIGMCIDDLVVATKVEGAENAVVNMYQIVFDVVDQLAKDLSSGDCTTSSTKRPPTFARRRRGNIIGGVRPPSLGTDKLERKVKLPNYPVAPDVQDALLKGAFSEENPGNNFKKLRQLAEAELGVNNYSAKFHLLLQLEEMQCNYNILRYSMSGVSMVRRGKLMFLKVKGLAERRPSVLRGDRIYVTRQNDSQSETFEEYEGFVHIVELDQIGVGFSDRLLAKVSPSEKYDVRFTFNRLPLRLHHRAVDLDVPSQVRFPKKSPTLFSDIDIKEFDFKNKLVQSNPEQRLAVLNIVRGKIDPVPYIVFGPPGTGKTVTLVESICQIIEKYEGCTILACAPSNSACDHLTKLLLKHQGPETILRMHAASRLWKDVPEDVRLVSNFRDGEFFFPPKKEFENFDIIICTLVTAGRIASAGFEKDYFTHVFVDEAGQATEPECMTAISGILSKEGQLVLAGDPMQLGPVVASSVAKRCGLGVSYLERLMNVYAIYQKNEKTLKYDNSFISKLLKNYRSHKAILKVPNECFYENELLYEVKITESMERVCKWTHLPQVNFPVIFEGVGGQDKRESSSPSFFNPHEVAVLMQYVENTIELGFSGKNIGIISPYRKQVEKIRQNLRGRDIKVGTVEEFQGQEREVIIISTVRSSVDYLSFDIDHNLGFLSDPKRFNVAVTRAKSLLIVIGNPNILSLDYYWKTFLEYCINQNAYRGIEYEPPEIRKAEMENVLAKMGGLALES